MRRVIQGIPFIVHSPSLYQIDAYDDDSDIREAAIAFDGVRWTLHIQFKQGYTRTRDFRSLAAAVALISGRRAA
jgi:hypothetical protein